MAFEVSAVVPHFEREELLAQTLESIAGQSEPPSEIIVVDDGSRRPPESVCRRFGAQLLSIPHTGKPGAVRNHSCFQSLTPANPARFVTAALRRPFRSGLRLRIPMTCGFLKN